MARKLRKIISGGQTGGDFGGLLAGRELKLETGGTAPRGYRTDVGPNPRLKEYGLGEHAESGYVGRTRANVDNADLTIAFRFKASPGTDKTIGYAKTGQWISGDAKPGLHMGTRGKPVLVITEQNIDKAAEIIRSTIGRLNPEVVNIAGHREASHPGIEQFVRQALVRGIGGSPEQPKVISTSPAQPKMAKGEAKPTVQYQKPIGPAKMATRPLRPINVPPSITGDKLVTALKGMGDDFSSDNIRATIQRMVDAGEIAKSDAGHLAMLAVYAGDRIEGVGAGQAQLGGMKPVDERYFEGSPSELAAMRRKRSGLRKELATSVPAEYKPILKDAFGSEEGRRLVANALTKRFKKGKIPTGQRTVERLEESVRSIGYGTRPGQTTLSLKPVDDSKDPARGPAPGREGARVEARKMSTGPRAKLVGIRTKPENLGGRRPESRKVGLVPEQAAKPKSAEEIRRAAAKKPLRKLASLGARASAPEPVKPRKGRQFGSPDRGEDVGMEPRARGRTRTPTLVSRVVGPKGKKRRIVGPLPTARMAATPVRTIGGEQVRSSAQGTPEPSDRPLPRRMARPVRERGQAMSGYLARPKGLRPTLEGVLARIAAMQEPSVSSSGPEPGMSLYYRGGRGLGGAAENVPVTPPIPPKPRPKYKLKEYAGPSGKAYIAVPTGPQKPAGRVIRLPGPVQPKMGRARRKAR